MANFDKYANLDRHGWNRATATLSAETAKHVHIGLWGEGPDKERLLVRPVDPSICVIHEEPESPHFPRWRHFLITPRRPGNTAIEAIVPGTKTVWATMTLRVAGAGTMRLVFFPGERTHGEFAAGTIYLIGGGYSGAMEARGGLNLHAPRVEKGQGGHSAEPTPGGHYVLGPQVHVTTKSWPTSAIPWGAGLRLNRDNEIEFRDRGGRWIVATGRYGMLPGLWQGYKARSHIKLDRRACEKEVRSWFVDKYDRLLIDTWVRNDFGEWGWNLTRHGAHTPYWLHTTPENEGEKIMNQPVKLMNSHGCVHINPVQRDIMMKAGFLKAGMPFEVRPYSESGPPPP